MLIQSLFVLLTLFASIQSHIIDDFGAVAEKESWAIAQQNSQAFLKALSCANASTTDRTVIFPADRHYFMYAISTSFLQDVTIQIDSVLKYSDDIKRYPAGTSALIHISESHGITLTGKGRIDGQGLIWWRRCYLGVDDRPDMVTFQYSTNILIHDLFLYSSPKYSLNFKDCAHVTIHDITIYINSSVTRGLDDHPSVTYALNTDGMDLAVYNATLYNNNIINYDDGIVVKPCRSDGRYCTCAGKLLVCVLFYITQIYIHLHIPYTYRIQHTYTDTYTHTHTHHTHTTQVTSTRTTTV
ncbi:hypothetical protein EON63_20955 [archaeon]|nr:MAG: hypothetical protein EON63_20955 [archaeon]